MDNIINAYIRQDAINDGVLIDVTKMAKEAGIKFNTCITQGLHSIISNIPDKYKFMDYNGRLWDALTLLAMRAKFCNTNYFFYDVIMPHTVVKSGDNGEGTIIKEMVKIYAVIGPGDKGEPVITIMLPGED